MAKQFFIQDEDIQKIEENIYSIKGKELKHMQVLRINTGDIAIINKRKAKILKMDKFTADISFESDEIKRGEPSVNVTLYQAFLKENKMEFVTEKAVELGVKKICPFFSSNTIVKLDEKAKIKRKEKLSKVAFEATKQCFRTDEVEVLDFKTFKEMLNSLNNENYDAILFAYENEEKMSLKEQIDKVKKNSNIQNIAIIIGAEGGFNNDEVLLLNKLDKLTTISLGDRILRAETAAMYVLSVLMYEFEK